MQGLPCAIISSMKEGVTETKPARIAWVDMAKGYGILAVMTGHLTQGSWAGAFVYSFNLPVFLFLSGYLFTPKGDFKTFFQKRCRSILLPYFGLGLPLPFFNALYDVIQAGNRVTVATYFASLGHNFVEFVVQNRYLTLWYLAMLFGVNLVMFFLVKIRSMLLQGAIAVLSCVGGLLYYHFGGISLPWNIDAVTTAILFFWAGYAIKRLGVLEKPLSKSYLLLLWTGFLAINIVFNILSIQKSGVTFEMFWRLYGAPYFSFLSAFSGIFAVLTFSKRFTLRPVEYIGRHSILFYLWHQTIIFVPLDVVFELLHIGNMNGGIFSYILTVLVKIIISCLILWGFNELLLRTKYRVFLER